MRAFRYLVVAASALALAACTVHQNEAPTLTGPSELALNVSVTTSPQSLVQNGSDTASVTAKVFFTDSSGQTRPKTNVPVRFDVVDDKNNAAGNLGVVTAQSAVTDSNGIARTTFIAAPLPAGSTVLGCNGVPGTCVRIIATVTDSTGANAAVSGSQQAPGMATILLMPPGVLLPPAFTPKAAFTFLPTTNLSVPVTVSFDASASCATDATGACSPSGSIVSYVWSFGDGGSGSGKTVTHTYTSSGSFVATLTVTSDRGISASTSQTVTVTLPSAPTADFVFSPGAPTANTTVFFNGGVSKAATGHSVVQYSWNFGDPNAPNADGSNPNTASGVTATHVYTKAGDYSVVLTIADDTGQTSSKSTKVTIQ